MVRSLCRRYWTIGVGKQMSIESQYILKTCSTVVLLDLDVMWRGDL